MKWYIWRINAGEALGRFLWITVFSNLYLRLLLLIMIDRIFQRMLLAIDSFIFFHNVFVVWNVYLLLVGDLAWHVMKLLTTALICVRHHLSLSSFPIYRRVNRWITHLVSWLFSARRVHLRDRHPIPLVLGGRVDARVVGVILDVHIVTVELVWFESFPLVWWLNLRCSMVVLFIHHF